MNIKIKSNEKLFSQYNNISQSIYLLSCMVQNDMEVDETEISEWNDHFKNVLKRLKNLHLETLDYLSEMNK